MFGISWDDERIGLPIDPIPSSAWIDPLGKFFAVPDCGHTRWAEQQFGEWNLERKGWVHLSFGNPMYDRNVRQAQIDTLFDTLRVYRETGYKYADELAKNFQQILDKFMTED